MKMRTNRNAWGMKFKAAGSGLIVIQGIGNYCLQNDHPEKMNEGKLGVMNRNEFLSGWVGVVCF